MKHSVTEHTSAASNLRPPAAVGFKISWHICGTWTVFEYVVLLFPRI